MDRRRWKVAKHEASHAVVAWALWRTKDTDKRRSRPFAEVAIRANGTGYCEVLTNTFTAWEEMLISSAGPLADEGYLRKKHRGEHWAWQDHCFSNASYDYDDIVRFCTTTGVPESVVETVAAQQVTALLWRHRKLIDELATMLLVANRLTFRDVFDEDGEYEEAA